MNLKACANGSDWQELLTVAQADPLHCG